ncbi:unnamed protein product [Schistocephalus solidus]|uniref:valine--tRNA ligase n=1 Tax=Schistocephalus solidus TaxID=70667 RepID=A0A183SNV1_SCHSO|nr:unnamed protein product [Schistocephalus solidus]
MVVERHLFGHTCDRQDSMNPRLQMGREAFVQEVWKWKDSKGSSILAQLNRLGLLLDWSREYFTLSPDHNRAVSEALYRLFKDGLLYRSNSLIFWCCHLRSAISDIEVDHKILTEMTRLSVPGYAEPQPFGYVDVFDYQLAPPHQPFVSKQVNYSVKLCLLSEKVLFWAEQDPTPITQEFWIDCVHFISTHCSRSRKPRSTVPVATTRLETMLADTALAVHTSDTRYAHLIGQSVLHPFYNSRHIPIIADDEHVDPNQGTGVVKVSPGHSMVDWEIATRHGLRAINMLADDGTVNFVGGPQFQGLRRFSARQHLVKRLSELGLYRGRFAVGESAEFLAPVGAVSLPVCSRSGDVIEPLLREQWFVNTDPMADAALRAVQTGQLRISPSFHEPTWCDWLAPEKRRHWCISRQVWWGHRMPAYRVPEKSSDLQSTEAFDCSTFYPLSVMETGQDILFFWVARMAMLGIQLTGTLPFNKPPSANSTFDSDDLHPVRHREGLRDVMAAVIAAQAAAAVMEMTVFPAGGALGLCSSVVVSNVILLHGLICDSSGQKMSKSRGNTIDPLQLIEGVGKLKQVWQSMQFLLSVLPREVPPETALTINTEGMWSRLRQPLLDCEETSLVDLWILYRLAQRSSQFNRTFSNLCSSKGEDISPSHSLHNCVSELRNWWTQEFCSVYLEVVKQRMRARGTSIASPDVLVNCFLCGLRLLHPITPHLSEVLWQSFPPQLPVPRKPLLLQPYPEDILVGSHTTLLPSCLFT